MDTNKEVIITTRVDKKIADQLKKVAKQKQIRFSSYVRRVLINSLDEEKKKDNNG